MDILNFYQIVGAVILGNGLSALVFYTIWRSTKAEKNGLNVDSIPFPLVIGSLFAVCVVAFAALTATV